MGTCWNCQTQVTLQEGQTNCDSCKEIIFYHCNSCGEKFEIIDKKTKNKLEECKLCGYFKCPHCDVCYHGCKKYEWQKEILKILRKTIPLHQFPALPQTANEIVKYFELQKISIDRKNCAERNVPISYAKSRIKSLLAKFEGFRVKDKLDREAFLKRVDEITEKPIETILTVNETREKGSYGQEYRDAFNLLVCLGKLEIKKVKKNVNGEVIEYEVFVRCEKGSCKYLAQDDLIINYCPICKKVYPKEQIICSNCPPNKKGKNKGEQRQLKKRLNNKDTCQMYRGLFI